MDLFIKYNRSNIQDRQIDTLIGLGKGLLADPLPPITFPDNAFLFAGTCAFGRRKQCQDVMPPGVASSLAV